jgi:hypothetical protein
MGSEFETLYVDTVPLRLAYVPLRIALPAIALFGVMAV